MSTIPNYSNVVYTGVYATGGVGGSSGPWAASNTVSIQKNTDSTLQVNGDANFNGNLNVKGRNLIDWLETVESRLGVLKINPKLESEFDELKALGDAYRAAEKRFLEQKRLIEILKKTDE